MASAQWDDEFVANLAAECPVLGKSEVMSIRRSATANETRVLGNSPAVIPVTDPARTGRFP